jgi:hypothetical protein
LSMIGASHQCAALNSGKDSHGAHLQLHIVAALPNTCGMSNQVPGGRVSGGRHAEGLQGGNVNGLAEATSDAGPNKRGME